jgi:hypothetical protein
VHDPGPTIKPEGQTFDVVVRFVAAADGSPVSGMVHIGEQTFPIPVQGKHLFIPEGTYRLEASAPGFKVYQNPNWRPSSGNGTITLEK